MLQKLLAFFLLTLFLNNAFAQDKKALFFLSQGENEFKLRNYAKALDFYDKYFERDSSNSKAFFRSGQIYESLRNIDKATSFYKKTISFDSTNIVSYPTAYMYLGTRALEKGDYVQAKTYLEIALNNTKNGTIAFNQLQKQLQKCDLAIKSINNPLNIKPEKLDTIINARKGQYFPVLTADGNTLIFTALTDNGDENLYISEKQNGAWQKPNEISNQINTPNNEGTSSISVDGKIMVFTSCEGRKTFGGCDLYITRKEGEKWSEPENLGANVNSSYWDSQPSLSPDGSQLFFSSNRPYGVGKKDLWMTELDEKGNWKKAINLGSSINTSGNEISPFIHANGKTLFYSSDGREGMGNHDIYMTDFKLGKKSESFNLGYPINTPGDETGLFISADGKTGLYSASVNNRTDIYQFEVPKELSTQFERIFYIKGHTLETGTKVPLFSTIELVNSQTGEKISKFLSDPISGDYMSVLPEQGQYILYVETPGYFFKSVKFNFNEKEDKQLLDIYLTKIEKQGKETLDNIFFDTGSAILREDSGIELNKLTEMMVRNPKIFVEISGHTDDVGNDEANMKLSNQRANSVIEYLKCKGIAADRLLAKGYGKNQPKVPNNSESNRQLNRRIELMILKI